MKLKRLLTIPVFLLILIVGIYVPDLENQFIKLISAMYAISTPLLLCFIWDVFKIIPGQSTSHNAPKEKQE